MSALVFLGIAVVLSLAGCLVLWLRSRQPGSMDAHIRDFARELDALAPGDRTRGRQGNRDEREPRPPAQGPPQPPQRTVRPQPRPGPERGGGPERPSERGTEGRAG